MTEGYSLAIESAVGPISAALFLDSKLVGAAVGELALGKAEELTGLVERLLRAEGVEVRQLSVVSVSHGPGSHTGIRIGLSFAKGLGAAVGAEIRCVSLFDGLRQSLGDLSTPSFVAIKTGAKAVDTFMFPAGTRETLQIDAELESRMAAARAQGMTLIADSRLSDMLAERDIRFSTRPFAVAVGEGALAEAWIPVDETEFLHSKFQ